MSSSSPPLMTPPSKRSARKVLAVAGRPLRRVGRRFRLARPRPYGTNEAMPLLPSPTDHSVPSIPGDDDDDDDDNETVQERGLSLSSRRRSRRRASTSLHHTSIVARLEAHLRYLACLLLAYLLGVYQSDFAGWVRKGLEYTVVAWLTTVAILLAAVWHGETVDDEGHNNDELFPLLPRLETRDLEANEEEGTEVVLLPDEDDGIDDDELSILARKSAQDSLVPSTSLVSLVPTMPHPALEPYFVIDMNTGQRIVPNDLTAPYPLDTEYFTGEMVAMIRTPDVDDPNVETSTRVRDYLMNKQRRFEFQFQVRLKKVPHGRVYFSCQLDEPVKMGMIQRAFVSAAMAFVKTTNNSFHYSITGSSEEGTMEKPHMAFPVEEGMNRVVATPPGQPLPVLGGEIYEDPESIKARKKGARVEWNVTDTYTFSLWSAYCDFLDWRAMNLPGIRPFDLSNVMGPQHIILSLYEIADDRGNDKHYKRDMQTIVEIEMSHIVKSGAGPATRQWMQRNCAGDDNVERMAREITTAALVAEEEQFAELGEGIYVRSGDAIAVRESTVKDIADSGGTAPFLTYAGGFAVLQETSSSTIIIQKVGRVRSKSAPSRLIRSGDTVVFKLVTKDSRSDTTETRHLSVHKGWWLKWTSNAPTKNEYFTIYTHETECSESGDVEETQSSYLTLGGSFWLRHKRWSKYHVGASAEASATYGGRILGLFSPKNSARALDDDMMYQTDDVDVPDEQPDSSDKRRSGWLLPLQLRAYEPMSSATNALTLKRSASDDVADEPIGDEGPVLFFSKENLRMDAPAWLEIMNRKDRTRQLTFAIRIAPNDNCQSSELQEPFIRLRTGRQLSHIMRAGLNWRNSTSPRRRRNTWSADIVANGSFTDTPVSTGNPTDGLLRKSSLHSFPSDDGDGQDDSFSDNDWMVESGDEIDATKVVDGNGDEIEVMNGPGPSNGRRPKGRKFIGKLAQSVKSKTTSTGKTVVRQSMKVGKGTVNAGKAIIASTSKKPPAREPKSGSKSRKHRERDLHAAVSRSMKRIQRKDHRSSGSESLQILAGELSAPEQSCRTVSNMLVRMSSLPSSMASSFSAMLALEVKHPSPLEEFFLTGGSMALGVVPSSGEATKGELLHGAVVARCLWESHWREEWCAVYETGLSFYAPLGTAPCLELALSDVHSVRSVDPGLTNPLPGFSLLALETAWMCHYAAFADDVARDAFKAKVEEARAALGDDSGLSGAMEGDALWQARFWQGFQSSLNSSLSSGRGKWADVQSGPKPKARVVLNNRRMDFDLPEEVDDINKFVEDLLSTALSFSRLGHLKAHPEALVKFLDATSQLRCFGLNELDLSSASAFCVFVNLYHCLLQHALLVSANGPLHKRSFMHFMRTSCYEIGGDVFSLAELHCCIIRGKMSRPLYSKPPAMEVPKKSNAYQFYALGYTSPRVTFLLNTGDMSCPKEVPVLTPDHLDAQMNIQAAEFLRQNISVDASKRWIVLPKACEIYRNDFATEGAGAANVCLRYCLSFLDDDAASAVQALLEDESSLVIKYQNVTDQYHTALRLREFPGFEPPLAV